MSRLRKTVVKKPSVKKKLASPKSGVTLKKRHKGVAPVSRAAAAAEQKLPPVFFIVPPVLLALIFFFCYSKQVPQKTPRPVVAAPAQVVAPTAPAQPAVAAVDESQTPTEPIKPAQPAEVEIEAPAPEDINNDLAPFALAANMSNILVNKAEVSQSGGDGQLVAQLAIDGSLKNDAKVAAALPENGERAWWMATMKPEAAADLVSSIVIYGGGSASPEGKLVGGFKVELETADGKKVSREFCRMGFALEGHELWQLPAPTALKSIKIIAKHPEAPVVLREVQAISATQ